MTHKGCGGSIEEDWHVTYEHEEASYPRYYCGKCFEEILGDAQIDMKDYSED